MRCIFEIEFKKEDETILFAQRMATLILFFHESLVFAFSGDLGTGKTTFIRAMLRQLGIKDRIKSPTFTWVESYDLSSRQIHHFDLYRLNQGQDLESLGFRDYFTEDALCCIEWAERSPQALSAADLHFFMTGQDEARNLKIEALSVTGERILSSLMARGE